MFIKHLKTISKIFKVLSKEKTININMHKLKKKSTNT